MGHTEPEKMVCVRDFSGPLLPDFAPQKEEACPQHWCSGAFLCHTPGMWGPQNPLWDILQQCRLPAEG